MTDLRVEGTLLACRVEDSPGALVKAAAWHTVIGLCADGQNLEELFHTYYTAA